MRITKYVDQTIEVEVDVGAGDVTRMIAEAQDPACEVETLLNRIGLALRSISDERIGAMSAEGRKVVHDFLIGQADRYLIVLPVAPKEGGEG